MEQGAGEPANTGAERRAAQPLPVGGATTRARPVPRQEHGRSVGPKDPEVETLTQPAALHTLRSRDRGCPIPPADYVRSASRVGAERGRASELGAVIDACIGYVCATGSRPAEQARGARGSNGSPALQSQNGEARPRTSGAEHGDLAIGEGGRGIAAANRCPQDVPACAEQAVHAASQCRPTAEARQARTVSVLSDKTVKSDEEEQRVNPRLSSRRVPLSGHARGERGPARTTLQS